MSHGIRGYARDLTQQEWEVIKPLKEICPENQPAIRRRIRVERARQQLLKDASRPF